MDSARSWADAIAVGEGKILCAGSRAAVGRLRGAQTEVVDLGGRMILPGFQDSHVHLVAGGIELGRCSLSGLATRDEIFKKIGEYAAQHPDAKWVVGDGWELTAFENANPKKEMLDRLVADRPAYMTAMDGHSAWVNSRALREAGVTRETQDPRDGRIERDPASGEPAGTLRESAMTLVSRIVPRPSEEDYAAGLKAAQDQATRFGITSIVEASANDEILNAYADADARGELKVRVLASIYVDPQMGLGQIEDLKRKREQYRGKYLRSTSAKIFADGVIESGTAALLEPYLNRKGSKGLPIWQPAALDGMVGALDKEGFQIHVHAIGDYAIRMSLDALEKAERSNGRRDARHHLAHLELIQPLDIPRFRELGVLANFQGLWAYADPYITRLTEPALGPARSRWLYPIGSLYRSGAVVVGGSDWSVSSMNPLDAIQVAVTRRGLEDGPGTAWLPQECVNLSPMLAAYTINGAYLAHEEEKRGSIEAGKAADLIVLDRNLFAIAPAAIHQAKVLWTLRDGKEVYRAPGFVP
jgi:predicted amidohydrolase YtcJ